MHEGAFPRLASSHEQDNWAIGQARRDRIFQMSSNHLRVLYRGSVGNQPLRGRISTCSALGSRRVGPGGRRSGRQNTKLQKEVYTPIVRWHCGVRRGKLTTICCHWYEVRAQMTGWNEETWCVLYQVGRMQAQLDWDWRVVLNSYLQAYNFRPSRLEPMYWIARFYRDHSP